MLTPLSLSLALILLTSIQLAYNQTREIQEAAQRVLDAYVKGLLTSVGRIQGAVAQVQEVFQPVEDGLGILNEGLDVSCILIVMLIEYPFSNVLSDSCYAPKLHYLNTLIRLLLACKACNYYLTRQT